MIKGLGVDIVEIDRITKMISRYGDLFLNKVFTPSEITFCSKHIQKQIPFAGRWAVKEAFYKALPRNLQKISGWKSVQLARPEREKPFLDICDERLRESMTEDGITCPFVSVSHEKHYCVATVILQ